MAGEGAAKQFSFRLPAALIERVDQCRDGLTAAGLELNRADVVRLLLKHALDTTRCDHQALFRNSAARKRARKA